MMRIYLAGPWSKKALMTAAHAYVRRQGLTVVSTWTEQEDDSVDSLPIAMGDLRELAMSDTFILMNLAKSEGKATELGFALAQGKRIILVGERVNNVFLVLPQVEQVATLGDAVRLLTGIGQLPAVGKS